MISLNARPMTKRRGSTIFHQSLKPLKFSDLNPRQVVTRLPRVTTNLGRQLTCSVEFNYVRCCRRIQRECIFLSLARAVSHHGVILGDLM